MARKLKVFQAQLGFYDTVVAAASQAAALRAWGTHHDLFADGMARLATDEKAIEAALRQPETPLKRAIGTNDPFGLNPGLPNLPDLPRAGKPKPRLRLVPQRPLPVDRSALDSAEATLRQLEEDRRRAEGAFQEARRAIEAEERILAQRRRGLEAEEAAAATRYEAAWAKATRAAARERRAYETKGGA